MRERGRRRMKRGAAQSADEQDRRQHRLRGGQADQAQHADRDHRARPSRSSARPPAIRQMAEADLRDRRRDLKQHRQRAGRRQRQTELAESAAAAAARRCCRSRPPSCGRRRISSDGRMRASAPSEARSSRRSRRGPAAARGGAGPRQAPGRARRSGVPRGSEKATTPAPMAGEDMNRSRRRRRARERAPSATSARGMCARRPWRARPRRIFVNVTPIRRSSIPARRRRSSQRSAPALNIAASAVPAARPRNPNCRTSIRLIPRFASTEATLTSTGVGCRAGNRRWVTRSSPPNTRAGRAHNTSAQRPSPRCRRGEAPALQQQCHDRVRQHHQARPSPARSASASSAARARSPSRIAGRVVVSRVARDLRQCGGRDRDPEQADRQVHQPERVTQPRHRALRLARRPDTCSRTR